MGTSKSNSGPSKRSALLPDWVNPAEDTGNNQSTENAENSQPQNQHKNNQQATWKSTRNAFASYYKSSNNSNKLNIALSRYVSASGGSRGITSSILAGKSTGIRFGSFLNDIVKNGSVETIKKLGIQDLEGKSLDSIFAELARTISPAGNEADDPYARSAISEALTKVYEELELQNKDILELDNLNPDQAFEFFELYITSYISEKLTSEIGKNLENKEFTEKEVIDKEFEMKEYIKDAVKLEFKDINLNDLDLSSSTNKEKIDEIFETAYQIMELL